MSFLRVRTSLFMLVVSALYACHSRSSQTTSGDYDQRAMHHSYDDSTLTNKILPVLMPYNRLIDPAGSVIRFGDPDLENHSLDIQLIKGTPYLAVEDRYGIAIIDSSDHTVNARFSFSKDKEYKGLLSTYSGLKAVRVGAEVHIFWSAASAARSCVMEAVFVPGSLRIVKSYPFKPLNCPMALPNELAISEEGEHSYLYVVLNGNNQLVKIDLQNGATLYAKPTGVAPYGICIAAGKVFVSNWAGPVPADSSKAETAGVPYGKAYVNPVTGATSRGSVSVYESSTGKLLKEIETGLHPNAVLQDPSGKFIYVAEGNSDEVAVIDTKRLSVTERIPVQLMPGKDRFTGDTPDGLALNAGGTVLYVACGMDNAIAMVQLGRKASVAGKLPLSKVMGFIPTEAYPAGLALHGNTLFVCNLEAEGSRISNKEAIKSGKRPGDIPDSTSTAYNSHQQKASISIIQVPGEAALKAYTLKTRTLNFTFREEMARLVPRADRKPVPMPQRIGEPSVFKHVVYIIKENRTYDQVLGDMPEGRGASGLCIFGDSITPNQHQLARDFVLMDNYYASGKCSAEGHQWTDAGMVSDYVEKMVRAWFRSYPHVQEDALVYNKNGFIWNQAADHGKSVRIYGEASKPNLDPDLSSKQIYENYQQGLPLKFHNTSTISRVRSMLSPTYPASDELKITDQIRADAFIAELDQAEKQPGDHFQQLSVMALSDDHSQGTRPGLPLPRAMVADNDLALGRIVEAISKSRFWKNTVIFVTEDDSQAGWDHISAYRTTGFVISPYSRLKKTIGKNYNQTSMLRSIEQILGIPPMNMMDASALPMFDCFTDRLAEQPYVHQAARISINQRNPELSALKGKSLKYAKASLQHEFDHVDGGSDQLLNQILWYSAKGNKHYPFKLAGKELDD